MLLGPAGMLPPPLKQHLPEAPGPSAAVVNKLTKLAQVGPVEGGKGPLLRHQVGPLAAQHARKEALQVLQAGQAGCGRGRLSWQAGRPAGTLVGQACATTGAAQGKQGG